MVNDYVWAFKQSTLYRQYLWGVQLVMDLIGIFVEEGPMVYWSW
jgi:hypothetical protein